MTTIVQTGDDVLRGMAEEVPLVSIKTPKIKAMLKKMTTALSTAKDGVALAAPQIGIPFRIFIVLKEYTEQKTPKEIKEMQEKKNSAISEKQVIDEGKTEVAIFIN